MECEIIQQCRQGNIPFQFIRLPQQSPQLTIFTMSLNNGKNGLFYGDKMLPSRWLTIGVRGFYAISLKEQDSSSGAMKIYCRKPILEMQDTIKKIPEGLHPFYNAQTQLSVSKTILDV
ncbi:hypothetical protein TNCV_173231 [Trichonephila clavipes]|nr:hypothetical protein TNCV_173231 [Trichonephila clavipes]